MATRTSQTLLRQLNTLFNVGAIQKLTDGQLLERFTTDRGEASELAFAALIERHGPMVLRVCRAQLRDSHDTQDAFQATFLILIKKARTLWVHDSLGPWLHQVAFRTAACARASIARRRRLEVRAVPNAHAVPDGVDQYDLERVLHSEIDRLPDRYRIPIVLCDLEGLTCEEAARTMGRPVGTVKCWRARARDRLRSRLLRRGIAPAVGLAAALNAGLAQASAESHIARTFVADAASKLTSQAMAGTVSAAVCTLVDGVIKSMFISKLRITVAGIVGLAVLAAGLGVMARVLAQDAKEKDQSPAASGVSDEAAAIQAAFKKDKEEIWKLTLPEAIRIGLEHSDAVRVVKNAKGGGVEITPIGGQDRAGHLRPAAAQPDGLTIAQASRDLSTFRFKSEIMAHIRSVEQQYWALSLAQVDYWATANAVALCEQILKQEDDKPLAGGSIQNRAEAQQQLDRFRLDLVDKTANLINTERQLRNLLSLTPNDGRRIVPATLPSEVELKPDWDRSKEAMIQNQPDIMSTKFLLDALDPEKSDPVIVERQKGFHEQVIHQSTHSLARFFLEVESNYKLFKTAGRLKEAAKQRMAAHAGFYEKGTITIDRYLDAVNRWKTGVVQEAQYKAQYNTAIAALEAVKGTLLERDHISVLDGPKPTVTAAAETRSNSVKRALAEPEDIWAPNPAKTKPSPKSEGATYSFQFSVGTGPNPFEIRGSFTVAPAQSNANATTGPHAPAKR